MSELEVADVALKQTSPGVVEVYHDGKRYGEITAAGLCNAAEIGDKRLSIAVAAERKNDD